MLTPGLRALHAAGRVDLVPLQYRAIYDWLEREVPVDIALLQLAAPDAAGRCAFGLRVDFAPAVLAKAKRVVAEINAALPVLPGCPTVPFAAIDYAVAVDRPPGEEPPPRSMPPPAPSAPRSRAGSATATACRWAWARFRTRRWRRSPNTTTSACTRG